MLYMKHRSKKTKKERDEKMAQGIKFLPGKHEGLTLDPKNPHKMLGMGTHACYPAMGRPTQVIHRTSGLSNPVG